MAETESWTVKLKELLPSGSLGTLFDIGTVTGPDGRPSYWNGSGTREEAASEAAFAAALSRAPRADGLGRLPQDRA